MSRMIVCGSNPKLQFDEKGRLTRFEWDQDADADLERLASDLKSLPFPPIPDGCKIIVLDKISCDRYMKAPTVPPPGEWPPDLNDKK